VPENAHNILDIISQLEPGSKVEILGRRGQQQFRTEAVITERPRIKQEQ